MRKYIRSTELHSTLQQILNHKNPELLEIYKSVIVYRVSKGTVKNEHLEKMLFWPVRTALAFVNMLLLPVICTLFVFTCYPSTPELFGIPFVCGCLFLAVFEAWRFSRLAALFSRCKPYLLVDELFARKILVVQPMNKTAKAAK